MLNMCAHFKKCEISRQSQSTAQPLSPEQAGVVCSHCARQGKREIFPLLPLLSTVSLGKALRSLCWGLGDSSLAHIWERIMNIYIYTLLEQPSSEETKVWWTDQNAWASMRPLNTYAEGAEAVVLCSPQFGSTEKLFQSSYPWGKKSHTKTCYERWVGSDVVNTCLNLQQCHTSASVGGKWSRPWKQIVPKPKDIRYVACIKLFLFNDAVVKHQYWCDPWTTVFRSSADHSKCHNPLQKGSFS